MSTQYKYEPHDTQINKISPEGLVKEIPVLKIHENKLIETSHGIYFRVIEEFRNLLDDTHIRFNLYRLDLETDTTSQVVFDMQLVDLIFAYQDQVCATCSELVYRLEGNRFNPIGAISLTPDQFVAFIDGDVSVLPEKLLKPKRYNFEYEANGVTYSYVDSWMFISENNLVVNRKPINFKVNNLEKKMLQINDAVYGFVGDYMNSQQMVRLCQDKFEPIMSLPWHQFELAELIREGDDCLLKQIVSNDLTYEMNSIGEMVPVIRPEDPYVLFKNGKFYKQQSELPEEPIWEVKQNNIVRFYTHHAFKVEDGKVTDAVMLPLQLRKGQEIRKVEVNQVNVNGLDMELGFLDGFLV